MKKILSQLTIMSFITVVSFNVSAQNNKQRLRDDLKSNYASSRIPGNISHSVQKNPGTALLQSAMSGYYIEDFEGATFPPAGWQAINVLDPANVWEQSIALPYSGNNSAYMTYSAMGVDAENWLILPQFTIVATDSISFWFGAEYIGFPPDSTFIMVSTTDSLFTSFTDVVGTLAEGDNYPDSAGVYRYHSYDLSAYVGQDIYIAIKNKNTYGDGIFIDKLILGTKPAVNAASVSIDIAKYVPVGTMSPMATFLNDGNSAQTFPVTMTITGGYSSTKNISNLAAGATQQVTFDPWTTAAAGNETVSVQTQLAGDGFSPDDSIATPVVILEPFTNYGWVSKAPMSIIRFDAAAAAINSNDTSYLFALGGITTAFAITNDAGQYFPYSNSWSAVTAMGNGNFTSSGASHGNKFYVIGGYNPNFTPIADNQVYDITTGAWSAAFPMPTPVGDYAIGVYKDSLFYYLGGYDGGGDQDIVQIYNPATDTWQTGTPMPAAAAGWRGGIMGNKIVVTGGYNQVIGGTLSATYIGDIDPVDPTVITWAAYDDYPSGTISRHGGGASLDETSGLVVFTGGDPSGTGTEAADATFAYDLLSNSWKIGPPKITPGNNLCNLVAIVDNDSLWMAAVGGYDGVNILDVNEWLNMGPYVITTGIDNMDEVNAAISCSPNPFVKSADIKFSLIQNSNVKAAIVDVVGNEIEVLCDKTLKKGNHDLKWNAVNYSNGVYFCKLVVNGKSIVQKLLKY